MKYKARHVIEYVMLRMIIAIIRLLPYIVALCFGWILARLIFWAANKRAENTRARIREVFGTTYTEKQVHEIAWLSWRNFVFSVVDMTRLPKMDLNWVRKHILNYEKARDSIQSHFRTGKGAVLACPHIGAWEVGGVALQLFGAPMFFFAARQRNPLVNDFINQLRGGTGVSIIERDASAIKTVIKRLRSGDMLGFLPDVRSQPGSGIPVDFLGKRVAVPGGMAMFARHAGVPIIPTIITRVGWTKHLATIYDPIWPDPKADKELDAARMTQEVFNHINDEIRRKPEQWFWFNKRWIFEPAHTQPDAVMDATIGTPPSTAG